MNLQSVKKIFQELDQKGIQHFLLFMENQIKEVAVHHFFLITFWPPETGDKYSRLPLTKFSILKKTLALPLQNPAVSSLDKFGSSGMVVMTDSEGFLHQQEASTASSNFSCPEGFRQCLSHPFACYSVSFLLLAPLLVSPTLHGPGGKSMRRSA